LRQRGQFLALLRRAQRLAGGAIDDERRGVLQFVLLSVREMAALNHLHLQHQGATDVITYDFRDSLQVDDSLISAESDLILAEIYLCPEIALESARKYQQSPSRELVLYAAHGLLHLYGEDDVDLISRAKMRAAEERVLTALAEEFDLDSVGSV
jgi:probable rRNA maturation factor